jgi:hypothetical protein
MAAKARQHTIPASFLARFSADTRPDRRERRIWVAQRNPKKVFSTTTGSTGFVRGEYGWLDSLWTEYERHLTSALNAISQADSSHIDGETWLKVLVPFVASLLVRGPEFEERFSTRLGPLAHLNDGDAKNPARALELQRILAPVLAARWIVFHTAGAGSLLASDVGWCSYRHPGGGIGIAIPIGRQTVLALLPRRTGAILVWSGERWMVPLEHHVLSQGSQLELNQRTSEHAYRHVFGSSRAEVETALTFLEAVSPLAEPFPFAPLGGLNGIANEFTWDRLPGVLGKAPEVLAKEGFEIDAKKVKAIWPDLVIFSHLVLTYPIFLRHCT